MKKDRSQISADVVGRFRKGNEVAFEMLFDFYSVRLYRFIYDFLKEPSEVEEIVQDVFFKVWKYRKEIKSNEAFKSYLYKIALNNIRSYFSYRKKLDEHRHDLVREYVINSDDEGNHISYDDAMHRVEELIQLLPAKRREIFLLSRKEGLSTSEIANYLDVSEATVKNQITSAMNFLRNEVKKVDLGIYLFFVINY